MGLSFPSLQHAVEQGQVIAGIIQYHPDNPFFIYQAKTWTFLAQFSAIGLRLGFSEVALSLFFSGLAGVLAFSGLALWTFAVSDDIAFSLLTPFLINGILNTFVEGFNYQLGLLGLRFTYGMIGMGFVIFVCGLFGIGQHKWGWFLAGLSLTIHPSLGIWLNIALWISWLISHFKNWRQPLVEAFKFSSLGYLLSAISLIAQWLSYQAPPIEAVAAADYMRAYLLYWDNHRLPIDFGSVSINVIWTGAFVCLTWLLFKKDDLSQPALFLLRLNVITVTLGSSIAFLLYSSLPIKIPDILWVLMPSRFLNLPFTVHCAIMLGLLWRHETRQAARAIASLVIVAVCLTIFFYDRSLWPWYLLYLELIVLGFALLLSAQYAAPRFAYWTIFFGFFALLTHMLRATSNTIPGFPVSSRTQAILLSLGLTLLISLALKAATQFASQQEKLSRIAKPFNFPLTRSVSLVTLGAVFVWSFPANNLFVTQKNFVDDFYHSPLYTLASKGTGQLLVELKCHNGLMQLYTRRPILSNTPMNMLAYSIESAPQMEKILRDIYSTDYFAPPPPEGHTQTVWEKRSAAEWIVLGKQYHFGDLFAPSSWKMQLPNTIFNDGDCALYNIPTP